ncbi:MAG: Gfo/Idh/MocA family oxidoreductase [Bacteroidia bacterium]|nr:Gfo/Idh/MocA family oxidoreductase [Bacteroidia bacterium]
MKNLLLLLSLILMSMTGFSQTDAKPVRIGIDGFTHTHVHWLLGREKRGDIDIVGIAEPNKELAMRYLKQHGLDTTLWYASLPEMVEKTKPEAVCAFNTISQHLETVEYCAARKIHVMVEKPLAVSLKHAKKMEQLAKTHGIHLLTNYETTWYPSNHRIYELIHKNKYSAIGEIRKVVIHDGHPGPIEIGCNEEFLEWLTDPEQNGAGALTDFGCYGADLMTWLMKGEKPLSVFAVTQQIKPELYPKVDDEATIVLTYPKAQAIIQASWNWTYNRKDMEVYGKEGYFLAKDRSTLMYWENEGQKERQLPLAKLETPLDDPFALLAATVRGTHKVSEIELSSLEVNMTVMEILDAAMKSAKSGKAIQLR